MQKTLFLQKNGKIHYAASCDYEAIKVDGDGFQIFYKDGTPASPWKSPVHMKQEHSRITLRITGIKVEKLGDISEEDARKEGFIDDNFVDRASLPPSMKFRDNWNATHKKPEHKFEASPWVYCYTVEAVK